MSAVNLATADRKNVRGDWVFTLAGAENRAKLFGPETATAPVLEAPRPSELNQRGTAPAEVRQLPKADSGSGGPRAQGVCLMTESLLETRVLPDPLVPRECVVRYLQQPMPVDPREIRDSDFALLPARIQVAKLRLRSFAWNSNPAASLPNSPRLWKLAGVGGLVFKRHSHDILGEWTACSDGRLYHPFLAEHALRLWQRAERSGKPTNGARRLDVSDREWRALRAVVFARDGFACVYCGGEEGPLHCDHVIPFSKGGPSEVRNLVTACAPCNMSKSAHTAETLQ